MRTIYIIEIKEKSNHPNLIRREKLLKIAKDNREKKNTKLKMAARESKSGVTNGGSTTPQQDCFPLYQKYAYSHSGHCPCPILHFNSTWVFSSHRPPFTTYSLFTRLPFPFLKKKKLGRLGSSVTCVTNVSVYTQLNVDTSGI